MLRALLGIALVLTGCRFDRSGVGGSYPHLADSKPSQPDAPPVDAAAGPLPDRPSDISIIPFPDILSGDLGCPTYFKCTDDLSKSKICVGGGQYDQPIDCHLGCDDSTGRCKAWSDIDNLVHYGRGHLDIKGGTTVEIDTGTCRPAEVVLPSFTVAPPEACIVVLGALTVHQDGVLKASGSRPLIILASQAVTIGGLINVGGHAAVPGPGGGRTGEGCGGGASGDVSFEGASGGAGGSLGDRGGNGGGRNGSAGPYSSAPCNESCSGWIAGGSGGGGGATLALFPPEGGGGGGGLQIVSLAKININATGMINASGGGGGASIYLEGSSGAGGGSGGAVRLESFAVTVKGIVAVNGGGGGSGAPTTKDGNPGTDGAANSSQAPGGAAIEEGGAGGPGSGGELPAGDGQEVPPQIGIVPGGAGGGGGGPGRICVRVENTVQALADARAGIFSPPYRSSVSWPVHVEVLP